MANVADETARRREIRRRKILDNSEERWKKIVGNDDGSSPTEAKEIYAGSTEVPPIPRDEDTQKRKPLSRLSDGAIEDSLSPRGSTASLPDSSTNGTVKPRSSFSSAYAFPKKVSDTENRTYCRSDSHRSNSCTQLVLDTLQIDELSLATLRSWIVLLVAAVVHFLISFEQNTLYTKSIIIPFCLLEAAFITYEMLMQKVARIQGGGPSLLGAALVLSGMSPSLVGRILRPVNSLLDCLKDLSVYLFCFTLFHVLYRLC